jgi:hypothetical protein
MSDPVTYSFYGTTVPVLRNIFVSVTSILNAAKAERANATDATLPSDQEILDSKFGDMLPFRYQPSLMTKFSLEAVKHLQLAKTELPTLATDYTTLDEVIEFYQKMIAVFDSIDEKTYNESANKGVDVPFETRDLTLHMTGMADYYHCFVIPHSYFHLNAMYMLLRNAGFKLGKGIYIGTFMSETQQKDWAPLSAGKKN